MRRMTGLIKKEFIQILRDRRALRIMIIMPLMFLFLFGYAGVTQVRDIPVVVVDLDKTDRSDGFVQALEESDFFQVAVQVTSLDEVKEYLDTNQARVAITIPTGFAAALARGEAVTVDLAVDGTDPMTASSALAGFNGLVRATSEQVLAAARVGQVGIRTNTEVWYNPDLEDLYFIVPGLIGAILLQVCLVLTSQAIVRERERGTMERLVTSPLRPYELIFGKLVPYALIAVFNLVVVLLLSSYWFGVPIRGSIWQFMLAGIVYIISCLGFGLFISTVSYTQQQAIQLSMLFLLPSLILSGFIYHVSAMPEAIQAIAYITPLRYFVEVARGIMLKGNDISQLLPQLGLMLGVGLTVLGMSVVRFTRNFS